ncbi:hypothetical protein ASC82_05910 [Streptomyces sp. Root431]|nr:hypothetical protein ASC82_05910 [Streptomyces sp. Root431]
MVGVGVMTAPSRWRMPWSSAQRVVSRARSGVSAARQPAAWVSFRRVFLFATEICRPLGF